MSAGPGHARRALADLANLLGTGPRKGAHGTKSGHRDMRDAKTAAVATF